MQTRMTHWRRRLLMGPQSAWPAKPPVTTRLVTASSMAPGHLETSSRD